MLMHCLCGVSHQAETREDVGMAAGMCVLSMAVEDWVGKADCRQASVQCIRWHQETGSGSGTDSD